MNKKNIIMKSRTSARLFCLISVFAVLLSCNKSDTNPQPEYLDVTPFNIAGEWELVQLNGESLGDIYFKIRFDRSEKTYEYWSNHNTSKEYHVTGDFNIITDPEKGAILRGDYDHDNGYWNRSYIVKNLTKDSMTWVSVPTSEYPDEEVQIFKRIKK